MENIITQNSQKLSSTNFGQFCISFFPFSHFSYFSLFPLFSHFCISHFSHFYFSHFCISHFSHFYFSPLFIFPHFFILWIQTTISYTTIAGLCRRRNFPFRKQAMPFLRTVDAVGKVDARTSQSPALQCRQSTLVTTAN